MEPKDRVPDKLAELLDSIGSSQVKSRAEEVVPGIDCPSPFDIARLATDSLDDDDKDRLYAHVGKCDYCARLLAEAREDLLRPMTKQESEMAAEFDTASPEMLARISRSGKPHNTRAYWYLSAAAAVIVGLALYAALHKSPEARIVSLLEQSYRGGRPFEFRLSLTGYAALSGRKAPASGVQDLQPLHQAGDELAQLIRSRPESPSHDRLAGLVELLNLNANEAIIALQKAVDKRPEDLASKVDLAVAVAQRADSENREADFGRALNLLAEVLQREPSNPAALFDAALVCERLGLFDQALAYWNTFLSSESTAGWRNDAETHVQNLRSKKNSVRPQ